MLQLPDRIIGVSEFARPSLCFFLTASLGTGEFVLAIAVDVQPLHAIASGPIRSIPLRTVAIVPRVHLYRGQRRVRGSLSTRIQGEISEVLSADSC